MNEKMMVEIRDLLVEIRDLLKGETAETQGGFRHRTA